jgi:5-methylcytosine-specific restriction endonuclease McrA
MRPDCGIRFDGIQMEGRVQMPKFELDRLASYDDEALLAELRRVAALVDSPYITRAAFDMHSKASSSVMRRRFGGWQKTLSRAGFEHRFSGAVGGSGRKARTFTDEELLAELRTVSEKLGGAPVTVELFSQHAAVHAETVRRRFGSWWMALKRAGLSISNLGKRYSEDDYFENLLTVWTHHGRQPKYGEMDQPPSCISSGAYEAKWGTWTKALLAFLERANADMQPPAVPEASTVEEAKTPAVRRCRSGTRRAKEEDRREIKLGLRYEVLKRDRFRCVLCGASPATQLACVLHVDHVIPYSKGGKTVPENLRTACESCNLGKSAKLEGKWAEGQFRGQRT